MTRRGATCLLRNKRPFVVADDYMWMLKNGLKIKCVLPEVVRECSAEKGWGSLIAGRKPAGKDTRHSFLMQIWYKVEHKYLYWMNGRIINHNYQ